MDVGPFKTFDIDGSVTADLYLLRFGEGGKLLSEQTARHFEDSLTGVTDVFIFSHGWNSTFDTTARSYQKFIEGYIAQYAQFSLALPQAFRPALVGVIWPSISFLFPWEKGPKIAADPAAEEARKEEMLRLVVNNLQPEAAAELVDIIDGRAELTEDAAKTAADILIKGLRNTDPDNGSSPPEIDELLRTWAVLDGTLEGTDALRPDPDQYGGLEEDGVTAPNAAGSVRRFDPRNGLRLGTLWLMKDRAGKVGALGVGPLVKHVLDSTLARVHLVGHSFGARVVLSSLGFGPAATRRAHSMLLLQPAVNRWCFADKVVGTDKRGGYHPVLERVELPIMTTYSKDDFPLCEVFHLGVRGSSLGEPKIAAIGDTYRYGALGGYGPLGIDTVLDEQDVVLAGAPTYKLPSDKRVIALDGGINVQGRPAIADHGDINNPAMWWALHCLAGAP
jgi:hypothetical protein